ncbi:MAG: VOC family protein [Pseudomonadota bacterium]
MARVTGIGGFFIRTREPKAMAAWYAEHLGVGVTTPWMTEAGPTAFATFPSDTDYFGHLEQGAMLNLRVDDLDAMMAHLSAAGIAAERREEWDGPHGRFARIHDPEGNSVELWEPGVPPTPATEPR